MRPVRQDTQRAAIFILAAVRTRNSSLATPTITTVKCLALLLCILEVSGSDVDQTINRPVRDR
jgi:hypothetical protein